MKPKETKPYYKVIITKLRPNLWIEEVLKSICRIPGKAK
jgi:hypothetical protein